jgi:hypothetical protein
MAKAGHFLLTQARVGLKWLVAKPLFALETLQGAQAGMFQW